jgi:hypothetical protein
MQAWPAGHALSKEHGAPAGTLTSTHAFSVVPQWTPEQNGLVPGPMHRQLPAHGCPHPIVPAGAHVAGSVVEVVVVVLVVGGTKGAHSIRAGPGVTVRAPN